MSTPSVVLLDELKSLSIEEFLHTVLQQGTALTVQLPTGEKVIVQPQLPLLPLPILDVSMPEGWKDAIYS
jgi:hypothetical protein